jgi:hypothetical protein
MSSDIINEMRQAALEKARKQLRKIGRNPEQIESFIDLIDLGTEKKTLDAAINLLDPPVPENLVERLSSLIAHPDAGIRCAAFDRVAITLKDRGTDFYVRCLDEPKFRDKSMAIYRLYRHGNESAVPAVAKRLRQILNTRKGSPYHFHNGETELTHCLDFLHRFRHCKEVLPALQRMIEKWEILSDKEVSWITDQLEFFGHADLHRETHCLPAVVKFVDSDHPVFEACESGDVDALRVFLDQGTSVYSDDTNRSLSSVALRNGHLEILKLLVEYGLNLERPVHGFREFPILRALRAEKWDIADYILSQGIDLNRRDEYGSSIFNTACWGFVPIDWLSRMIDLGGDVHHQSRGETPIFSAVRGNAVEVIELLVSRGADLNATSSNGDTPLISAARGGKVEAAKWLIDHGADLRQCQYRDRDALYWARENKHPKVEAIILSHLELPP